MSKLFKFSLLIFLIPCATAKGPNIPAPGILTDDSETIGARLKESMDSYGLISVEQHTGRLLFSPAIEKLQNMPLKQKFLLPAMILNQSNGLRLITELPFSCFLISGSELVTDQYKGFNQFATARYLQDVKSQNVSRVLICQAVGLVGARTWGKNLSLTIDHDNFVFKEHDSLSGEHFYYFLNSDGMFEMYLH